MIAAQGQPPLHAAPVPAHPLQQHQEAYGGEFASAFHQSQQQQQSSAPLPPISAGEGWTQRLNQDCKENRSAGRLTTAINERPQTPVELRQQRRTSQTGTSFVPGRGQVIRPSTTPTPTRHQPFSQPNPEDDNQNTAAENVRLREEIRRLQTTLLERFRGNSKFVSGGQFRGSASRQSGSSEPDKCSGCSTMRGQIKRIKVENRDLRSNCEHLEQQAADAASGKARVEMQLQHMQNSHGQAVKQLTGQLQHSRDGEAEQRDIVKQLTAQLQMLRSKANSSPPPVKVETRPPPPQKDPLVEQQLQVEIRRGEEADNRIAALQAEMQQLRTSSREWETKYQTCLPQVQEQREACVQWRTRTEHAEDRVKDLESKCGLLQLQLDELTSDHSSVQGQHDDYKKKYEASENDKAQLLLKLGQMKAAKVTAEAKCKDAQKERDAIKEKLKKMEEECMRFKGLHGEVSNELKVKLIEIQELLRRITVLEETEGELRAEIARLNALLAQHHDDKQSTASGLQGKLDELTRAKGLVVEELSGVKKERESLKQQQAAKAKDARDLQNIIDQLKADLVKAEKDMQATEERARQQQKLQAQALETAMQSLVRLCVVAPTVNVHLGDQTMGCKAPLPQDTIRMLVEHQILPNFTSIFLQAEEGAGPGGTMLDQWLEGLLTEMQGSIEKHLKHVFQQNGSE